MLLPPAALLAIYERQMYDTSCTFNCRRDRQPASFKQLYSANMHVTTAWHQQVSSVHPLLPGLSHHPRNHACSTRGFTVSAHQTLHQYHALPHNQPLSCTVPPRRILLPGSLALHRPLHPAPAALAQPHAHRRPTSPSQSLSLSAVNLQTLSPARH